MLNFNQTITVQNEFNLFEICEMIDKMSEVIVYITIAIILFIDFNTWNSRQKTRLIP